MKIFYRIHTCDVKVLALETFLPKTMFEREKIMVANNIVAHFFISFLPNILFFSLKEVISLKEYVLIISL